MKIGSLFSGAGGLDMAVEDVFGASTAWHCEVDPAASQVLAERWSGIPNWGDITDIYWGLVEPVDILCGGYPCQPYSAAGRRKGTADERHLWPYFAEAVRGLRPRFVVLENVAGHRSMGFDRVLADLASIGYDAQWCSVRASDVGSCHRRERLFVLAHPSRDRRNEGWPESARIERRSDAAISGAAPVELLPTPAAARSGRNKSPSPGAAIRPSLDQITALLPTPEANAGEHRRDNGQDPERRRAGGHAVSLAGGEERADEPQRQRRPRPRHRHCLPQRLRIAVGQIRARCAPLGITHTRGTGTNRTEHQRKTTPLPGFLGVDDGMTRRMGHCNPHRRPQRPTSHHRQRRCPTTSHSRTHVAASPLGGGLMLNDLIAVAGILTLICTALAGLLKETR